MQILSSCLLNQTLMNKNKKLVSKKDLIPHIHKSTAQVILTIGAGDIGEEVKHIKKEFSIAS